ncbi:hypothetical protein [Calidifontibacillus oryziterrae]|uniref:hypothetical protein n=1 Tax=Calidifontibacillus oryziterrae TaxID=1191699 RepID=UPI000370203F|nr:hypothetical protein [Calidifontibacillus oryziterrae]
MESFEGKFNFETDKIIVSGLSFITIIFFTNSIYSFIAYISFWFLLIIEIKYREIRSYVIISTKFIYLGKYYLFGLICIKKETKLTYDDYSDYLNSIKEEDQHLILKLGKETILLSKNNF